MSVLTQNIEPIEDILDVLVDSLSASSNVKWNVCKFSGTSFESLFSFLPSLTLPAAVVIYQNSEFNKEPGRPQRVYHDLSVLVLVEEADLEKGSKCGREYAMEVANIVDDSVYNNAVFRIIDIAALDFSDSNLAPNVSCYVVGIEVGDH